MANKNKSRLITVQRQLSIARKALMKIGHGGYDAIGVAMDALEAIQAEDFKEGGNPDAIQNLGGMG